MRLRAPDRRLLAAVLALGAALGIAAFLLVPDGSDPESPPLRAGELPAAAFVDSVGVVVHFNYVGTSYERQAELVERLGQLGVRHIRDAMPSPREPLATGLRLARRQGIRATLATGDVGRDPADAVADSLAVMGDRVEAFEGPNELDNSADPAWPATLSAYMPRLEAAVRRQAPGVPLIGPSFVRPDSREQLAPDLPGVLNGHPYPGGEPPEPALSAELERLRAQPSTGAGSSKREIVFTETGYHNALQAEGGQPPASEQAAAVYLPRLLLAAFGAGVRRTFLYELSDVVPEPALADPVQHFGLLRSDLTPKPAFTAISTLITALEEEAGEGSAPPLRWRLRGSGAGEVQRLTLVRSDGSRVIALWRAVSVWDRDARTPLEPDPLAVELELGPEARDVVVWRPSRATRPVLRRNFVRRLELDLGGDVVLVSVRR